MSPDWTPLAGATVRGEGLPSVRPPVLVVLLRFDVGELTVYVLLKLVFLITTLEPGGGPALEPWSFVLVRFLRAGGLYCEGRRSGFQLPIPGLATC